MVLFASHWAVLKDGREKAFTNEVQWDVNFNNTKFNELSVILFFYFLFFYKNKRALQDSIIVIWKSDGINQDSK